MGEKNKGISPKPAPMAPPRPGVERHDSALTAALDRIDRLSGQLARVGYRVTEIENEVAVHLLRDDRGSQADPDTASESTPSTRNPRLFDRGSKDRGDGSDPKEYCTEITLRDLFAAFALAGLSTSPSRPSATDAKCAYEAADAMLAEREEK